MGDRLRARREEIVLEHVDAENACDYERALATFDHPRYEFVATDEVFEGAEQVMEHWLELDRAFPDQRDEVLAFHHADETVLLEMVTRGTHLGPLRGLPPTGRRFEQLGVASSAESLRGRVGTVVNHPLTVGRALIRRVTGR